MSKSTADSDATADEPENEQPEDEQAEQPAAFANRAARRAKGKATANPEAFSKGMRPIGRGAVQSPRQYGNRRSG